MYEGRYGNSAFNVYSYRGKYADLQNAYSDNIKKYYEHYLYFGKNEGRDGTPVRQSYQVRFLQGEKVIASQVVEYGHGANTNGLAKSGAVLNLNVPVSCITSNLDVQVSYRYIYNDMDYTPIFDADYYLNTYVDLRNAFGTNGQLALEHFINYGMHEGRKGNASFDVYSYRGRYVDLQNAYNTGNKNYYEHYLNWGIREGRNGSPVNQNYTVRFWQGEDVIATQIVEFGHSADKNAVSKSGADIKLSQSVSCITSDLDVQVSYAYIYGGIDYTSMFDAEYYLSSYSDLCQAFGQDGENALIHFIHFGVNEGRIASENFNVHIYRSRYLDLENAYGNDISAYYMHYLNCGINEGRSGK